VPGLSGDQKVTYCERVSQSSGGAPGDDGDAAVFRALADSTRRALLDGLFAEDGQTLGELCALAPAMSRYGVGKHLQILEDARLLSTLRDGRSKRHFLNPVPIARIADRWISKYAAPFTRALTDLEREVTAVPGRIHPQQSTATPPPPERP